MLRPLRDYVLIARDERADRVGSVLLPEIARDKGRAGTVVAVGPKATVTPGARVLALLDAGFDVRDDDGRVFWMMRDQEIAIQFDDAVSPGREQVGKALEGGPVRALPAFG